MKGVVVVSWSCRFHWVIIGSWY